MFGSGKPQSFLAIGKDLRLIQGGLFHHWCMKKSESSDWIQNEVINLWQGHHLKYRLSSHNVGRDTWKVCYLRAAQRT